MKAKKNENARSTLPAFAENLKAASAILLEHEIEISVAQLKRYKSAGCPAFRSTRVYLREFLAWVETHPEPEPDPEDDLPSKERLERLKLKEQWEGLKRKNETENGNLIKKETWVEASMRAVNRFNVALQRFHAEQVSWEGLTAAERDKRGKALFEEESIAIQREFKRR